VILATADSNIYISALQFGGVPLQFLNAVRDGAFRLAISEPIIDEICGVLRNKFRWPEAMLEEARKNLLDFTLFVKPVRTLNVIVEDPDDDRVIECAVASGSHFIVSGDKHLLRLAHYENIRVVKVAEFLTLIPKP
jgi:putative PIN family toxin of toxin-antitoxin system